MSQLLLRRFRSLRAERRRTGDAGFTLMELMVTSAILLVCLTAILGTFETAQKREAVASDRVSALDAMRLTLDQIGRDVREATIISANSSASVLDLYTYTSGAASTTSHVVYTASGTTLTRQAGTAAATTQQTGLASTALFSFNDLTMANVQLVTINLLVNPVRTPNTTVTMTTSVRLRNRS
jgi:prepilin-type N-terminal cleavage/methylation domain-containing protein